VSRVSLADRRTPPERRRSGRCPKGPSASAQSRLSPTCCGPGCRPAEIFARAGVAGPVGRPRERDRVRRAGPPVERVRGGDAVRSLRPARGQQAGLSSLGLLGSAQHSPSVGAALRDLIRHLRIHDRAPCRPSRAGRRGGARLRHLSAGRGGNPADLRRGRRHHPQYHARAVRPHVAAGRGALRTPAPERPGPTYACSRRRSASTRSSRPSCFRPPG